MADPPWRYGNTSTRGAAEDHYPTMTIEELCDLDIARERAADQAHLYLWATAGHLPEAFKVMEAWGFTYKTYLVWVKPQMGMGNYFRISTELVLFGVKGGMRTQDMGIMNYFTAPRGKHSSKPQAFYDLVAKASPGPVPGDVRPLLPGHAGHLHVLALPAWTGRSGETRRDRLRVKPLPAQMQG